MQKLRSSGVHSLISGRFGVGIEAAMFAGMAVAKRFEDLLVWQRMHELHVEVWKATEKPPAARDFKFRDQIRDASESTARNVAEGFGRFKPGTFAEFLDFSRASALETQALLKKGLDVGYLSEDEFRRLDDLAVRGLQALAKFQRYLRSPQAKRNAEHRYGLRNVNLNVNVNVNENENDGNENGKNDPNDPHDPNDPNDG